MQYFKCNKTWALRSLWTVKKRSHYHCSLEQRMKPTKRIQRRSRGWYRWMSQHNCCSKIGGNLLAPHGILNPQSGKFSTRYSVPHSTSRMTYHGNSLFISTTKVELTFDPICSFRKMDIICVYWKWWIFPLHSGTASEWAVLLLLFHCSFFFWYLNYVKGN